MRFWDSSALVALIVDEPDSATARTALAEDRDVAVWWGSRLECASAVRRRERAGALDRAGVEQSVALLDQLAASWFEILPGDALRAEAERALAVHPLRAADALQLAAALTWRGPASALAELVCFDERLRDVAAREGFGVLPAK
ncbi:MAG: type II toxin-antitoxin system VapC family toxin [Solirubrobacterales bacterium]